MATTGGSGPAGRRAGLEVWAGAECSVVRIGDSWRDQVHETGHHDHVRADIGMAAGLGVRRLRVPFLWERVGAGQDAAPAWSWHDTQMDQLRRSGIKATGGLLHHGAGPRTHALFEAGFAEGLAAHARATAERYPDIDMWTPVNEPLTTARFSCLYGHWHPHLRDESAFLRAVAIQAVAVLAAMRAIRGVSPRAQFLHTEDLGRVFSTPAMAGQAEYENQRRWLSLDLLCGRVDRAHPWRRVLLDHGVPADQLDELAGGEAAPDLIGINHYVTSDRFLDERLALYPAALHGGNGRASYVDTEAVRAGVSEGELGWRPRLREAWSRYGVPLVLSEVHLGCNDPAEQLRWLMDAWDAAQELRREDVAIRALTVWALFGLVDWNSMLRDRNGHYEPGVFDRRSGEGSTLLADAVRALTRDGAFDDGRLSTPGWWRREERVLIPAC